MEKLQDKKWWEAVGMRVLRTAAETLLGTGIGTVTTLQELNLPVMLSTTAVACIASFLLAIVHLPETAEEKALDGDGDGEGE